MTSFDYGTLPNIDLSGLRGITQAVGAAQGTRPAPPPPPPPPPAPANRAPGATAPGSTPGSNPSSIDPQSQDAQSARAIINAALATYGLSSLADTVWGWYLQGRPIQQIFLDLKTTPEYKRRFPAMEILAQKGHALSEAEYISLEETYTQLGRQFGLPAGFYDQPDDFSKLIANEVSPSEFQARLADYQTLAYDTDPTARNELQRLYGIDEGHIAAFLIDPNRALPLLQRQVGAAEVSAAAQRSGFGGLTLAEGELLSGIAPDQAAQGFSTLVDLRQVLGQLPGEVDAGVSRQTALGAVFQGDEEARQNIVRRQRRRTAVFEGGGSYATSAQGISGLG